MFDEVSVLRKLCMILFRLLAWSGWVLTGVALSLVLHFAVSARGGGFHNSFASFALASMILTVASICGAVASIVRVCIFRGLTWRSCLWFNLPGLLLLSYVVPSMIL